MCIRKINVVPEITIDMEPASLISAEDYPVYWIDGPAIPIFRNEEEDNQLWDQYSLEHPNLPTQTADRGTLKPTESELRLGQIKIKVCVNNPCIDYYYIYAYGPIGEDPQTVSISPSMVYDVNQFCGTPRGDPPNPDPITWNLQTNPPLQCGTYEIHVEGYRNDDLFGQPYIETESNYFILDKVHESDLCIVADIYTGDYYRNPGGTLNPHSNTGGTVDCSGYLTQVLRRLGRADSSGNYPIPHLKADELRTQGRLWGDDEGDDCISFGDLQKGDLIVWGDTSHVGIYDHMVREIVDDDDPTDITYFAAVWVAWGEANVDNTGYVGLATRELAVKGTLSQDLDHWHFVRRWLDNNVFTNCPEGE